MMALREALLQVYTKQQMSTSTILEEPVLEGCYEIDH
jgi:hypothetical protein